MMFLSMINANHIRMEFEHEMGEIAEK